jgi:type I restriction enzyme M protein
MLNLSALESSLWEAADNLRANSKLNANEYSMPVLGLIFLRHATNRFEAVKAELEPTLPSRGGKKRALTSKDFLGKAAIFLPEEAHYDYLLALSEDKNLGAAIKAAMELIEGQTQMLKGVLPKEYTSFDAELLSDLVRIFARDELKQATGDVFGRIYEYFLNKFAMTGAQEGGEFFTPPSLVRTIVNMIEPSRGVVFDPACGSAGMFVQTGHFLENRGAKPSERITFWGQEKSDNNIRLAKMNLAVHGLEGNIRSGNTFYDRCADLLGACDFVMSNPPFNVDGVSPEKVKTDQRLFTKKKIPGISAKTETVSNGNYLWIQYYYSYLKPTGRAGFVMASSASDAGHGEKEIREEIIATGAVDVMMAIGTNFFYTRSLPCTLWFFDRGKPAERKDKVLMIDARSLYRVISRKIRDFSEEQLKNLAAIAWLYRGEQDRYLGLVREYLMQTGQEGAEIVPKMAALFPAIEPVAEALMTFDQVLEPTDDIPVAEVEAFRAVLAERDEAVKLLTEDWGTLKTDLADLPVSDDKGGEGLATNAEQTACAERFELLLPRLKALQKHVNEVQKLTLRSVELAEKKLEARKTEGWNSRTIRQYRDALGAAHDGAVQAIKGTLYMYHQVHWLQSRFPAAVLVDVPGLCRVVTREEIAKNDSSLTPGRYVGVGASDVQDEEDFEERIKEIHLELAGLNEAAIELAEAIQFNFEEFL